MKGMFVTEPQIWKLIGVMAASLFGVVTLVATMLTRLIKSENRVLMAEIGGLHHRFDALDRDVHFLMRREVERDN